MICSRKPSRHKPSKKPPNLREQTVARGASLGKSPEALLSKGRLAATTSRQKRPSPSRDACSHLPAKEENREDRRSGPPRPRQILDRHLSPSPLSLLLVPRRGTLAVTSRRSKRAPTAVQDKLQKQSGRAFALRIAEAFASLSTRGPLPLSRISITWLTAAAVLTKHGPQHQAPGAYPRPRESFPL